MKKYFIIFIIVLLVFVFSLTVNAENFSVDPNSCLGYEDIVRTYNQWVDSNNPCEVKTAEHLADWLGLAVIAEKAEKFAQDVEDSNQMMDKGLKEVDKDLDFIMEENL